VPSADGEGVKGEPVYCLRVRGTEDLELAYEIVQPDATADILPVGLRRSIGLVRLGGDDRGDRDLNRLLGPEITDVDGVREDRRHTVSVFNGPAPQIRTFANEADQSEAVGVWLRSLGADGVQPHEIGVFVRSSDQVPRATAAAMAAGLSPRVLDDRVEVRPGNVNVATMHLAKGLEFRVVSVMACDDEVLPLQSRIEGVGDDGDLQEVYDTERQLLYVACTRARDQLSISAVDPASEFLDDLKGS
jgi:superfamily I DNA/RNA helicase